MSYRGLVQREEYDPEELASGTETTRAPMGSSDLRHFFAMIWARRYFVMSAIAVSLALAAVYIMLAATTYTATVSIFIDARTRAPVGTEASSNLSATPDAMLVESQVKLIGSDTVLRRVAQRERLFEDQDYVPTRVGLRTRLMLMLGLGSTAPVNEDRLTRATMALARSIAVKRSEKTYVIDVDLFSGDANKAARLANLVAEAYIADQRDARLQISKQESEWLHQRLADLQSKVQDAENRVQEFKVKNQISDAVGKNIREQELSDLTNELGRARGRTIETKSKYEQLQKLVASGRLTDSTTDALKSTVLEKLRVQYAEIVRQEANYRTTLGDRHPAMLEVQNQLRDARSLIAGELKRIADSASNEYQQARIAEAETQRRAEVARKSTDSKNQNVIQLRELERDLEASRGAYEKFLRARESSVDDSNDGVLARIIAPATAPLAPSAPKTMLILFVALLSGLCIGVGAVLVREYISASGERPDGGVARRLDFNDGVSLHVIASIPRIGLNATRLDQIKQRLSGRKKTEAQERAGSVLNEIGDNPHSDFSVAIGNLLSTLKPNDERARRGATTVLISSVSGLCGKTTIAVNLARAAVTAGYRTLLIDANTHHPCLASLIEPRATPGLIKLSNAYRPVFRIGDADENALRVVPLLPNEDRMRAKFMRLSSTEKMNGIRDNFDFVIIDGPTLEASENLRLVANAVSSIIVIAGPGEFPPSVEEIVETLDVSETKLAGTVESMIEARLAA